ncbi:ATP-grasp domain-containing protein [Massilia sp. PAMC28688]|uniref:ATP-grasp domain-containing protein n=1 Tax=Massilia sp. PAMC28688 TaxID=2861283 RepID=UPI001C62AA17|nr:ATP-grasp domain-containing protein [Massilia sp. PAMC28688]QYF94826.1 ATP-grasp domain-containing protein [Massilia sp. PAMC28688]
MRVWFNRTFSSVYAAINLIREADSEGRFHIIYSNANPHVAAARAAHEFHVEPTGMEREEYIEWCLQFCREQRVDIFIPGRESTVLAGMHARFEALGTRVLSAGSVEALELIHDKARFYSDVDLTMAPVAETRIFETVEAFDAAYADLRQRHAKLCVKPSQSVFGLGFAVLDEERSSAALLLAGAEYHIGLADMRRGLAEMGTFRTMLLMEYLDGHEFSVDCVGDKGRLVAAVPRKKPKKAGRGQLIDMRQDILDATAKLCADFGLNGCFNVQYREGGEELRLLEINPRMSGGIGMACVAGPNLPYIALRGFADGFDKVQVAPVRDGIRVAELTTPVELA